MAKSCVFFIFCAYKTHTCALMGTLIIIHIIYGSRTSWYSKQRFPINEYYRLELDRVKYLVWPV